MYNHFYCHFYCLTFGKEPCGLQFPKGLRSRISTKYIVRMPNAAINVKTNEKTAAIVLLPYYTLYKAFTVTRSVNVIHNC